MKCPFCNSTNISETNKIPRGDKNFITDDDKDIEVMSGWLHEITCNDCNRRVFVDKEIYSKTEDNRSEHNKRGC